MSEQKQEDFWQDFGARTQEVKALIDSYMHEWIEIMGLQTWDIESVFSVKNPDPERKPYFSADCAVQWEYKHALIRWFMPAMLEWYSDFGKHRIEQTVVHELCHILVNQMREYVVFNERFRDQVMFEIKHEEVVVTNLAASMLKARYAPVKIS